MKHARTISAPRLLLGTVVLVMALGTAPQELWGQTKTGTTVGQFLLIEPSARMSAMGNAGVTSFTEASAVFYNPGAVGHLPGSDVQFARSSWLADIQYNYAAAAIRVGAVNTLLLTVTSLNSGEIDVRTVDRPEGTGERYTVRDLAIGLGFSRRVTDRFSAGAQVKFMQETIWHTDMRALALDVGVLYELPFRAYLGASISNFGTRGQFDGRDLRVRFDQDADRFGDNSNVPASLNTEDYPLPIFFRVGVGYPITLGRYNTLVLAVDAFQPSDNTNSISLGGEWMFRELLSLRGGYQNLFQQDAENGLTLGAGLQYDLAGYVGRFDYAWSSYGRLDDVQRFTVGVSF